VTSHVNHLKQPKKKKKKKKKKRNESHLKDVTLAGVK